MKQKTPLSRLAVLFTTALIFLMTGCHSAKEFDYRGQALDTVQIASIDNRTPFPFPRDSWRLGPTREEVVAGITVKMGASEDGSMVMFRIPFVVFGSKSRISQETTEQATTVLDGISKLLQEKGFATTRRVAIVDSANVIGYRIGGRARVIGFYLFSKPGAYDALLTALAERPEQDKIPLDERKIEEKPVEQENRAEEAPDHGGGEADAESAEAVEETEQSKESFWDRMF